MAYHSGMQPTNRKGIPFSSVRQLPVRSALDACGFTLYLDGIVTQLTKNVKKKDGKNCRLFRVILFS